MEKETHLLSYYSNLLTTHHLEVCKIILIAIAKTKVKYIFTKQYAVSRTKSLIMAIFHAIRISIGYF